MKLPLSAIPVLPLTQNKAHRTTSARQYLNTSTRQHFYTHEIDMNVLTHQNKDEYSAQFIVSTSQYYRFQCAEVADMKASAGNKPAVVRWRFHEGQSSRSARMPFMEAERKHDSHCESCALYPATQSVPSEPTGAAEQISILINFNTSHFNTSTLL